MTNDDRMPFGPHRGKAMAYVPANYLLPLAETLREKLRNGNDVLPIELDYVRDNDNALHDELEAETKWKTR